MFSESEDNYLKNAKIPVRLAFKSFSGWPMIISMWYNYQDGKFLLATPKKAKLVKYLEKNPECAFEISNERPPYCGIRGQVKIKIDDKKGIPVLEELLDKYIPGGKSSAFGKRLLSRRIEEVAIELTPINYFSWNFGKRMRDSLEGLESVSMCPE